MSKNLLFGREARGSEFTDAVESRPLRKLRFSLEEKLSFTCGGVPFEKFLLDRALRKTGIISNCIHQLPGTQY